MSGCKFHIDACRHADARVETVACGSRYVLMGDPGFRVPITAMYDINGDETDDVDEVVKVEFGDCEFGYGILKVEPNPYPYEYDH